MLVLTINYRIPRTWPESKLPKALGEEGGGGEKSGGRDSAIFPDVFHRRAVMPPELDDRAGIKKNIEYSKNKGERKRGAETGGTRKNERESEKGRGIRGRMVQSERGRES